MARIKPSCHVSMDAVCVRHIIGTKVFPSSMGLTVMFYQHGAIISQTVLALRGSHGVGIEAAMVGGWICAWTPSLTFVDIYSIW